MKSVNFAKHLICIGTLISTNVVTADSWKPEPLEREEELAAALEAGPPGIQAEAGVYVLTDSGYELARESRNGFHCIVQRSFPDTFEPQCLDAEGSATLLHRMLLRGNLRMSGASSEEIDRATDQAWSDGTLRAPARTGINYMLSQRNRVPVDEVGTVIPYRPHVMFYAPYLTTEDLGVEMGPGIPAFVVNEGKPTGYIIVPVPTPEDGQVKKHGSHDGS